MCTEAEVLNKFSSPVSEPVLFDTEVIATKYHIEYEFTHSHQLREFVTKTSASGALFIVGGKWILQSFQSTSE